MNKMNKCLMVLLAFVVSANVGAGTVGLEYVKPSDGERALGVYISGTPEVGESGWYFDGYFSGPSSDTSGHYGDIIDEWYFGDAQLDRKYYHDGFHLGGLNRLTEHFSLYGGVGYYWKEEIVELYDPSHILSSDGHYTVEGKDNDSGLSISFGFMVSMDRMNLKVGHMTGSKATSIGMGWNF